MEQYIDQSDKKEIYNLVANNVVFDTIKWANETVENKIKLLALQKKTLEYCVNTYSINKRTKNKNAIIDKKLEEELKKSYELIMAVRTYFLGKDQEIQYKIYYRSGELNEVKIYTLTESELMNLVYRDKTTLRLPGVLSKEKLNKLKHDTKAEDAFKKHFDVINKFRHPGRSKTNYIINKEIESKYGKKERAYAWQPNEGNGKRGRSAYSFKLFNRGWIYQAFDATINKYGTQLNSISSEEFQREYFLNQLKYDNVKGFKGGDVGLNQIKTNSANLMSATTLINYLEELESFFREIQQSADVKQAQEKIQELFLNGDENTTDQINQHIDNVINNLLENLKI